MPPHPQLHVQVDQFFVAETQKLPIQLLPLLNRLFHQRVAYLQRTIHKTIQSKEAFYCQTAKHILSVH